MEVQQITKNKEKLMLRFSKVEALKVQYLLYASPYIETINKKYGGEDQWTAGQILFHLYASESGTLAYMKKKVNAEALQKGNLISWFKTNLLYLALQLPLKYKAPKAVAKVPEEIDFERLKRKWSLVREEMNDFLLSLNEQTIAMQIFKHPVAGRMNAIQALTFLEHHLQHHLKQFLAQVGRS